MKRKKVALALQGGGSWGAFSWGVLDRLLADPEIEIVEVSGTSAGAVSGSIISHAINSAANYEEGAEQARKDLHRFWSSVCDDNHDMMRLLSMLQGNSPLLKAFRDPVKNPNLPALTWLQHSKSINDANPWMKYSGLTNLFNKAVENTATRKLRALIRDFIPSYDAIREGKRLKLHVNAAELHEDSLVNRDFSGEDLSINAVMASATLQGLFKPVEIDGEKYYDGAYAQNPPLDPLMNRPAKKRDYDDVIWVMANPPKGNITPRLQKDIPAQELAQSAHLVLHHAYDHLAYNVQNEKRGAPKTHVIWFNAPHHYNQTSKQNTEQAFLLHLHKQGLKTAQSFLGAHRNALGKKTTVDLLQLQKEALGRDRNALWPKGP